MADGRKCGHEGCLCDADKGEREDGFCSDYCARHGAHEGHKPHACGCGHAHCEPAAASSPA